VNLGPDHPNTLTTMNQLGVAYWSAKQLDRSIAVFEDLLRLRKAKLGPDHPDTLRTLANLAVNYRDAGRLEEAIPLFEEALDRASKLPGGFPATLAPFRAELAATYDAAGQFAKAEPLHRSFLAQAQKQFGASDLRTSPFQAQLGLNLLHQKKYAEAEALLRDCLKVREQKQPDAWTTFNTQSMLGGCLLGQKKYAEAEPLLVQGYEGMKQRAAQIPMRSTGWRGSPTSSGAWHTSVTMKAVWPYCAWATPWQLGCVRRSGQLDGRDRENACPVAPLVPQWPTVACPFGVSVMRRATRAVVLLVLLAPLGCKGKTENLASTTKADDTTDKKDTSSNKPDGGISATDEAEDKAVASVKSLGGKVRHADMKANKVVVGVDLGNTKSSDANLKELAAFRQLQTLHLYNTKSSDAGLKELTTLKQLQGLFLNGTQVTQEGVVELRKALPESMIFHDAK
jgi:tetratricopeptide (TPR) repeat protein